MKIYLAGMWAEKGLMPEIAAKFEAIGCEITHKWWLVEDTPEEERTLAILRSQAEKDANGVSQAKCLVVINSGKSEGKAVEQGIALALNIPIIAVGKRGEHSKNVFHYLPLYYWVDSVEKALTIMDFVKEITNG